MARLLATLSSPCPLAAGALDDSPRPYCSHCGRTVHDLSQLGPDAAKALVGRGSVCVRATVDRQGVVQSTPGRPLRVALSAGLVAAGLASVPAVAALSKEPGQVGLLDWFWSEVQWALAPEAVLHRPLDHRIAPLVEAHPGVLHTEPAPVPSVEVVITPKPYNPIGKRDPFQEPIQHITGGISFVEVADVHPVAPPPPLPGPVGQAIAPHVSPHRPPPDDDTTWPPGQSIDLHTLGPVRTPHR